MPFHLPNDNPNTTRGGAHRNTHAKANRIRAHLELRPDATSDELCKLVGCSRKVAEHVKRKWREGRGLR